MATEEFTFPIISRDTSPSSIDSPPLWRLSPAASPDPHRHHRTNEEEEEEEEEALYWSQTKPKNYKQRKSCSDIKNYKSEEEEEEEEEEEKMDVLWEDFNEELCNGKSILEGSSRDMVELGCVKAFSFTKTSKNNGAIFASSPRRTNSNKQPGVVVFIRVLKRLFLLHNSPQHHHHQHHRHKFVKNRIW